MGLRLLLAVLLAAVCLLATAGAAAACSYAVPADLTPGELNRQLFDRSDGAFVGRLHARVPLGDGDAQSARGAYLFRIERRVKGRFPLRWVVVHAPIGGSLCGLELRVGDRTGLMVDRRRGGWHSELLLQLGPRALMRAARR